MDLNTISSDNLSLVPADHSCAPAHGSDSLVNLKRSYLLNLDGFGGLLYGQRLLLFHLAMVEGGQYLGFVLRGQAATKVGIDNLL